MEDHALLSIDQISPETHSWEEMGQGLVLITAKNTGDRFLLYPMSPPLLLTEEQDAFLDRYFHENRAFTEEENELLLSLTVPADQGLIEINVAAALKWFATVETRLGTLAKKLTPEELRNPLFWRSCGAEVTLKSGEVNSFVLINKRVPELPGTDAPRPILLSDVESIRPSPYGVPRDVLEAALKDGEEIHMGDSLYLVEAHGKQFVIDAYFDFRPEALFFKNGDVKGSELQKTGLHLNASVLYGKPGSESLTVTHLDGLGSMRSG